MIRPHTLLTRRPSSLASRLASQARRKNAPCPTTSIRRRSSDDAKSWPSTHPRKERLQEIKHAMQGKEPNAKPTSPGKELDGALDGAPAPEPTRHELYVVALHQAIPFVGFGIMDNAILLLAGEAIDVYLGVTLGISTMCAAAIGNIISDISGVAFGTVIEDALIRWSKKIETVTGGRIKLPPMPNLSYDQRNLRSVRWSGQLGCAAGLTVGCIIGMFPLLFFDGRAEDNGGEEGEGSASVKRINEQNEQLKNDVSQWKRKHEEVMERLKVLEREKNDGLWDRGY